MSTRHTLMPRFGFGGGLSKGMDEDIAYAPNSGMRAEKTSHISFNNTNKRNSIRRQPVSTRANDPMGNKVLFPDEHDDLENSLDNINDINDISGIVQDMSNIEDTSFAITIDQFNKNMLASRAKQVNTCKFFYLIPRWQSDKTVRNSQFNLFTFSPNPSRTDRWQWPARG